MFIHLANLFSIRMVIQGEFFLLIFVLKINYFYFLYLLLSLFFFFFCLFAEMLLLPHVTFCIRLLHVLPIKLPNIVAPTIRWVHHQASCMKLPVVLMTLLMVIWVFPCPLPLNCLVIISKLPVRTLYMCAKRHLPVLSNF